MQPAEGMIVVPVVPVPVAMPMVPGLVTHPAQQVWVMPSGGDQGCGNVEHHYHQGFGAQVVQGGQIPIRDFRFHFSAAEDYAHQAKGAQAYCAHIMVEILENLEQLPTCKPLSRKLRDNVVRLVWTMEPWAVEALLQHRKPSKMGQVLDLLTGSGGTKSQLLGAARKALMSMADPEVSKTPTPVTRLEEIEQELPTHLRPAISHFRDCQAELMRLMGLAMDHVLLAKQQSWTHGQTKRASWLIKHVADSCFRCVWVFQSGWDEGSFKPLIKHFMTETAASRVCNHMWQSYKEKWWLFYQAAQEEKKKLAEKRKLAANSQEPSSSNEDALDSEDSLVEEGSETEAETKSVLTEEMPSCEEDGGFDTEGDLESKGDEEEGGTMESLKVETKEEKEEETKHAKTEDVTDMAVIQPKGEDDSMSGGEGEQDKMDLIAPMPPANQTQNEKVCWADLDDETPFPTSWKWTEDGDCSNVNTL